MLGLGLRPTKDMADIVVTANLAYDRFDFAVPREGSRLAAMVAYYRQLFSQPHLDVSNGRPTVGVFQSGGADRRPGRIGGEASEDRRGNSCRSAWLDGAADRSGAESQDDEGGGAELKSG